MEIHSTQTAVEYFAEPRTGSKLIAHPSVEAVTLASVDKTQSVTAAIGPEGGWTEDEVESAISHGFLTLDLGSRIYRIETAATAIAAVLVSERPI